MSGVRKFLSFQPTPALEKAGNFAANATKRNDEAVSNALKQFQDGYPDENGVPTSPNDFVALATDLQPLVDVDRRARAEGARKVWELGSEVPGRTDVRGVAGLDGGRALMGLRKPGEVLEKSVYGDMFEKALQAQAPFDKTPNKILPFSVANNMDSDLLVVKDPNARSSAWASGVQIGTEPVDLRTKYIHEIRHDYLDDWNSKPVRQQLQGENPTVAMLEKLQNKGFQSGGSMLDEGMYAAYAKAYMDLMAQGRTQEAEAISRMLYNLSVGEFPNHLAGVKQGHFQSTGEILQPEQSRAFLQGLADQAPSIKGDSSKHRLEMWDRPINATHGPQQGQPIPQFLESQKTVGELFRSADEPTRSMIEEALNKVISRKDNRFQGVA